MTPADIDRLEGLAASARRNVSEILELLCSNRVRVIGRTHLLVRVDPQLYAELKDARDVQESIGVAPAGETVRRIGLTKDLTVETWGCRTDT